MCVLNMNASDTRRDIMEKVNVSYTKLREGARESGLTKLPVHKPVELMKTKDDQVNVFFSVGNTPSVLDGNCAQVASSC